MASGVSYELGRTVLLVDFCTKGCHILAVRDDMELNVQVHRHSIPDTLRVVAIVAMLAACG